MKHLIVPTDFSLRSLEPIRAAITHFAGEPLTVTLLHLLEPPTDILDGLRLAYRNSEQPAIPRAFTLAIESVSSVYVEQIHSVKVKVAYGSTVPVLRNLLQHLGADAVVFDPATPFDQPVPRSLDARPLLRRAMPRGVVETGTAIQPTPVPPSREPQIRASADDHLQPGRDERAHNLSIPANLSRHAS